jgi:hypothetical protein
MIIKQLQERDAMICRSCGNEERASEGYPCVDCGTFICQMCDMRGVTRCRPCQVKRLEARVAGGASSAAKSPG